MKIEVGDWGTLNFRSPKEGHFYMGRSEYIVRRNNLVGSAGVLYVFEVNAMKVPTALCLCCANKGAMKM